jgi:2-methylcitrate dehydratase PrpD
MGSGIAEAGLRSRSDILAGFVCDLDFESIPEDVTTLVRQHLLDSLGVALAGSATDFAHSTLHGASALCEGTASSVIGSAARLPAHQAALVNGVSIHCEDYDDTVYAPIVHPSSVIISSALAVAEARGATATQTLTAMAAGYEVIIRVGLAAPGQFVAHGFHGTSVCGVFGATAVAGKLMGLNADQMMRAFGIAGSLASGIIEYLGDGSSVKRFHPGWAALSGVSAATYAANGVEGPHYVFEGEHGLYSSFIPGEAVDFDELTRGLGEEWYIRDIAFKLYPMCHFLHAFADCVLDLRREHSIRAEDISAIRCYISPDQTHIVCEPALHKLTPRSPYEAKFSIYYSLAVALIDGEISIGTYTPDQIQRSDVLALAQRVDYVADPTSAFPKTFPARVEIELSDGTTFAQEHYEPRGSRGRPATDTDLEVKFRDNVQASGLSLHPTTLLKSVDAFEGEATVDGLLSAFAPL